VLRSWERDVKSGDAVRYVKRWPFPIYLRNLLSRVRVKTWPKTIVLYTELSVSACILYNFLLRSEEWLDKHLLECGQKTTSRKRCSVEWDGVNMFPRGNVDIKHCLSSPVCSKSRTHTTTGRRRFGSVTPTSSSSSDDMIAWRRRDRWQVTIGLRREQREIRGVFCSCSSFPYQIQESISCHSIAHHWVSECFSSMQ